MNPIMTCQGFFRLAMLRSRSGDKYWHPRQDKGMYRDGFAAGQQQIHGAA